jgi:hypothetical protein
MDALSVALMLLAGLLHATWHALVKTDVRSHSHSRAKADIPEPTLRAASDSEGPTCDIRSSRPAACGYPGGGFCTLVATAKLTCRTRRATSMRRSSD